MKLDTNSQKNTGQKLTRQEWYHIVWFFYLYLMQGVFNAQILLNPVYLLINGVSNGQVGVVSAIGEIPSLLKIPMMLISDKYNLCGLGNQKPYVFISVVCFTGLWLGAAYVDLTPTAEAGLSVNALIVFTVLLFFVGLMYWLFDGVVDGFIAESMPAENLGRIQGLSHAARSVGLIVSSLIFGYLREGDVDGTAWVTIFITSSVCIFTVVFWLPGVKELPDHHRIQFDWRSFQRFKEPNILALGIFFFITSLAGGVSLLLFPLYLQEHFHFSGEVFGAMVSMGAVGLGTGAVTAGYCMDKYDKHYQLNYFLTIIIGTFGNIISIIAALTHPSVMYAASFVGGFGLGMILAISLTTAMLIVEKAISASFLGIFNTINGIARIIGFFITGYVLEAVGFQTSYIIATVITVISAVCVPFIFKDLKTTRTERHVVDGGAEMQVVAVVPQVDSQEDGYLEAEAGANGFGANTPSSSMSI